MNISLDEINNFSKKLRLNILKMAKAGGSKSSHFEAHFRLLIFLAVLFKYFFLIIQKIRTKSSLMINLF